MKIKEKIYRVVVVDDHALFRAGLVSLLRQMDCFEVVGEAQNGVEAVDVVRDTIPDLVILDVNMPVMNGVGTVRVLRKMQVLARIVMLTISKNEADLMRAIQEGADGYLLKNAEPDQLKQALLQVMGDKSVISPDMVKTVFNAVRAIGADAGDLLTEREKDVLTCLVQGMTTKEIGDNLVISKNTVKTHVRNIMKKLDASNRAEIVGIALKKGLI
jgi:DNA-binding NarL/FixJ family response regulator